MRLLSSIDDIVARYTAVFCDVWGVIHNGRSVSPGAAEALQRLRQAGKHVILITNVPKPRAPIPAQLDRLGFPRQAYDAIVTSGDAIRAELAARAPGPMFKIGPERDRVLWEGLGLSMSGVEAARFVGVSGLNDDRETPEAYADMLERMRARNLDMLCANPDIVVRVGDELIWCAGALARDYAALGGRVIMAGKPHTPIYDLACKELAEIAGRAVPKAEILCIGDGVATDIVGANAHGFDSVFIASGMHGEALMTDGALDPLKIAAAFAAEGATAPYVMARLA
ncbi:MAG: TIGR01459 family HAD-type hydrolase [Hyphomonadaceae bacterium]|nr:TIGR01459 family HAD-type hydrolase [Hyphomonadaceae bacterium]